MNKEKEEELYIFEGLSIPKGIRVIYWYLIAQKKGVKYDKMVTDGVTPIEAYNKVNNAGKRKKRTEKPVS